MIIVTLVCPRPRIPREVEAKTVNFTKGVVDMTKATWTERTMMKELVSGPFGMRVAVTDRIAEPLDSDFLRFVGSSILKIAGTAAHNAVAEDLGADLAKLPFAALARIVGKGKVKEPKTAASGEKDMQTGPLLKKSKAVTVKIPLTAERDIYVLPKTKGPARAKKRRLVLKEGTPCGSVTFKAKVYEQ
jgi:hypothetical protein